MIKSLFITLLMAVCLLCSPALASQIGVNVSQSPADSALNIVGDYEKSVGDVDLEAEGQMNIGDVYIGNVDLSAKFNITKVAVKLTSSNLLQGPTLAGLGRQTVQDLSLVFPIKSVDVSAGVFTAQSNPFAETYELKDLTDPNSVEVSEAGIELPDGNRWGVSFAFGVDLLMLEVGAKGLLDPSNITHQGRFDIGTGGEIPGFRKLQWTAQAIYDVQVHKEEKFTFDQQRQVFLGISYQL